MGIHNRVHYVHRVAARPCMRAVHYFFVLADVDFVVLFYVFFLPHLFVRSVVLVL